MTNWQAPHQVLCCNSNYCSICPVLGRNCCMKLNCFYISSSSWIALLYGLWIAKSMSAARPVSRWCCRRLWLITVPSGNSVSTSILIGSKLTVLYNEKQYCREKQATESSEQEWEQKADRDYWLDTVGSEVPCRNTSSH